GLTRALDPYSVLITDDQQRRALGVFQTYGVGLDFEENLGVGPLRIAVVQPGGPAQAAGLRPGDEGRRIDGRPVRGMTSDRARDLLNDGDPPPDLDGLRPPEPVRVVVARAGRERTVTLERRLFRPETVLGVIRHENNAWGYLLDHRRRIAHVRIATLTKGT